MPDSTKIYFREGVTAGQRELVEQSIASMVERWRAEADAALARSADEDKLRDAMMAPLAKLIRTDREAAEALEKLGARQVEGAASLRPQGPRRTARDHVIPLSPLDDSVELRFHRTTTPGAGMQATLPFHRSAIGTETWA